jgi:GTPase Era involved in 16S rRNA processing
VTADLSSALVLDESFLQRHVMGESGNRIREIAYEAGQEMMNTFRCEVLLKLIVCY